MKDPRRGKGQPMKRQHKVVALLAIVALLTVAAACGGDDDDTASSGGGGNGGGNATEQKEGPAIKIGAQDFGESAILSEIYKQALNANGFDASIAEVGGFRDLLFAAFDKGSVNLAPEYVASE